MKEGITKVISSSAALGRSGFIRASYRVVVTALAFFACIIFLKSGRGRALADALEAFKPRVASPPIKRRRELLAVGKSHLGTADSSRRFVLFWKSSFGGNRLFIFVGIDCRIWFAFVGSAIIGNNQLRDLESTTWQDLCVSSTLFVR